MVNQVPIATLADEGPAREALKSQGVHSAAAKCIVWWRLGADTDISCRGRQLPSGFVPDPREFPDAQAIDDVKYVGPSAFRSLAAIAGDTCTAEPAGATTDVVFSPTLDLAASHAGRIINLIDNAHRSIDISMYSFSQSDIKDALLRNASRLSVRVLYDNGHLGNGLENALEDRRRPRGRRRPRRRHHLLRERELVERRRRHLRRIHRVRLEQPRDGPALPAGVQPALAVLDRSRHGL
ncbi:MAG: hypothetical protein JRH11_15635 [Deltaproteobacteria bacterium]|nr:hypothetical protein [Deltaproteobacteria bacterium]